MAMAGWRIVLSDPSDRGDRPGPGDFQNLSRNSSSAVPAAASGTVGG